jgi:spore coat polysaccharide biosynthesis protein SpsF (cytidylyltransferase family)/sialic acid synthase SpsE
MYNILEMANVHGGDISHLFSLIDEFSEFKDNFGIKFQPFKYDQIATPDFEWYPVYEELYFSPKEWKKIFAKTRETKAVWIDVFDGYSAHIIKENLSDIYGLKFQTSVLDNRKLFKSLSDLDLSNVKVIINIAGHNIEEIGNYAERIKSELKPQELILQVGFQGYPTKLEDSGLNKIKILKDKLDYKISFTEHLDPGDEESIRLPVAAVLLGADIIEKHIRHSSLKTKYDFQSSVKINTYKKYIELLQSNNVLESFLNEKEKDLLLPEVPFVNENEMEYLKKSKQKPLAAHNLKVGQLLSLQDDLSFKRSPATGITIDKIESLVRSFNLLAKNKEENEGFEEGNFRKAKIATIIACRMKSARLPKKAILPIGELSSIELCIKHAMQFEGVDEVILATSTEDEDAVLQNYTYSDNVIFHRGHPEDVIERYLGIANKREIDVVVRVTGDMQYISNDVAQILLKSHFETGADYTNARETAVGTNLEIMNVGAMRKIKEYFPSADYSEYMSYYFWNNPKYFKLNFVDLPKELVRDYRLTLDYPEDLEMFRKIEEHFVEIGEKYSLPKLFEYLDNNPQIAKINANCTLKYKTDPELIKTLKEKTTIKN